ncbi:hypothetical protein LTR35_015274 [Friedmanniomyces endolithicus]|uniref:Zn(2)-C6 fungal-type domain-containing protein n=1 Tax=Friedmanniomyces endolithicus TaxID=329885 RepID=A0AAN6FHT7_9PEZI|nr:hypothetical protein LTR35_015274 [Friedmanniomyces endolithicus]KAK0299956.1 hypothetical protein LTS00_001726 [Friedmanniomyces endolithicus]KAK0318043.1 hypothetical protein LTR82_011033 [Friedmanniomyces endolithicus]KAK1012037.1 hypothetical protein LTR54_004892 [Friedmanniomyces endolithicus]
MSSLDPSERRSEAAQRTVANSPRRAYYDLTRSTMEHYPPPNEPVMDPQITGGIADSGISGPLYSHGAEPVPPQSDVDDFLRKKRKAREHKACYPCRQRKVRCDLSRPCRTCSDRDHPELCSYHPPNKRQDINRSFPIIKAEDGPPDAGSVTLGRPEFDLLCSKLEGLEHSVAELRRELHNNSASRAVRHESSASAGANSLNGDTPQRRPTHTDVHGIHTRNDAGEIVHLGGGSIPAMLYALGQGQGQSPEDKIKLQEFLGKSILPLFGLDNESATYPFVDLWGLPHGSLQRTQELAKALPNDAQCLQLFRCYRDLGWVIYPGVAEITQFEQEFTEFLVNRAATVGSMDGVTDQSIYGKTHHWLAVLFAVLGSGAQCSAMPRRERELTSQVYMCCSLECLRQTNFLSQPNIESIQALNVIGMVIANNMNAGTAWSLLGLTIRLAQGLGLHRDCPPAVPTATVLPRSKTWWAIMWQDSLLSMTYDRASTTADIASSSMPMPQNIAEVGEYHASMYQLCKVGLDIVRDRAMRLEPAEQYSRILLCRDEIATITRNSAAYLRDTRLCSTAKERLEHYGLYLHSSYALSELYRPAISPSAADSEIAKAFRAPCLENLANTVESYLGINNITPYAQQSWGAMHRALSSALLLGILGEHTRSERARRLIGQFVTVIGDITNSVDPQEISLPFQRGLLALARLKVQEPGGGTTGGQYAGSGETATFIGRHAGNGAGREGEGTGGLPLPDQSALFTPADSSEHGSLLGEDHSPYEVLNTILWGES